MNEETYRKWKLRLLIVLIVGALIPAFWLAHAVSRMAENGRYVQYSLQAHYSPNGRTRLQHGFLLDTRNGQTKNVYEPDLGSSIFR